MNLKSYMATLQLVMIIWQGRSSYETLSLADADWHRLRQYSRQMEKLSDEVGEVADEVGHGSVWQRPINVVKCEMWSHCLETHVSHLLRIAKKSLCCKSSIIFCDICCFSSASRPYKAL